MSYAYNPPSISEIGFATPGGGGGIVSGRFYDQSFHALSTFALAGVADRFDLSPYAPPQTFTIDQIGVNVSTFIAAALAKVVIYSANPTTFWPDVLLYEGADLDCSSNGFKSDALSFTFVKGTRYWLGARHSSTASQTAVNVGALASLGLSDGTSTAYGTVVRSTLAYATPAPNPYVFTGNITAAATTSVRFRAV